jgi:hypothetical protein
MQASSKQWPLAQSPSSLHVAAATATEKVQAPAASHAARVASGLLPTGTAAHTASSVPAVVAAQVSTVAELHSKPIERHTLPPQSTPVSGASWTPFRHTSEGKAYRQTGILVMTQLSDALASPAVTSVENVTLAPLTETTARPNPFGAAAQVLPPLSANCSS